MAWQDKTLEAKYTSPSGREFPFHYEKVSRETNLKTGIFEFPDRDGAHVQHQGAGAKSFPLVCIFSGPDCMDQADAFEESLFERDVAELKHPTYGIIKVIPTGNIKREDDLVNALNESRVTVTFTETITDEAPPMDTVSADAIEAVFNDLLESSALDFAENISFDTVAEELSLQSALMTQAQLINDNMGALIAADAPALANFKTIFGEAKTGIKGFKSTISTAKSAAVKIENFVVKGLNVARLNLNLMKVPSRIKVDIMEKIKGYSILATSIASQFKNDPYGKKNVANAFHSTSLVLTGCTACLATGAAFSMAQASAGGKKTEINRTPAIPPAFPSGDTIPPDPEAESVSREESIQVINNILSLLETTKSFQDAKIENDIIIDSNSETYLLLNSLVYSCVQLIMNVSLSLPMRRTITLDQDRQIIELVCELYGSVDYIDKFISDNDLNADELEVLPMGREVTYHVQVA
jgi:prophage DNA circulation protein